MPTTELGEQLVHWRSTPPRTAAPILYVHGAPHDGGVWAPFLARTGGVAVDLPGFGASGKRADIDLSPPGLGRFLERFLDHLGWDRARMCLHDWGAVGLLAAASRPERVERVALIDGVPLLPGYRWHRLARLLRTPVLGELAMGFSSRATMRRAGLPAALLDDVVAAFDAGTQRALLRLHRGADEAALARAGTDAGEGAGLRAVSCPTLIVWGERDPYFPASWAGAYAAALGGAAQVRTIPGAGHWPWLDDPGVLDAVCGFLAA
jgi:pimeloyl-ACP methyl ester carboxylesterase